MRDVLTPIQAAAMAAERRLHDDLWCASQVKELLETSKEPVLQEDEALPSALVSSHGEEEPKPSWQCGVCTLLNQPLALTCEACGTQRIEEKKVKKTATTANTNKKMCSCKFCTLQNSVAMERCVACGEWEYSYVSPTATRGLSWYIKKLSQRVK